MKPNNNPSLSLIFPLKIIWCIVIVVLIFFGNTGFQESKTTHTGNAPKKADTLILNDRSFYIEDSIRAFELFEKAEVAMYGNEQGKSWEYIQESIQHFEKIILQTSDSLVWDKYISALFTWGLLNQFSYTDLNTALKTYKKGYHIALEKFGESFPGLSFFITKIGYIYAKTGDFTTAYTYFLRAFEHRMKYLPKDDVFHLNGYNGLIYGLWGEKRFEEALMYTDTYAQLAQKHHKGRWPEIATNMWYARIYQGMQNYPLALKYYNQGIEKAIEQNAQDHYGYLLLMVADLHAEKGPSQQALDQFSLAISVQESAPNIDPIILTRNYLAYSEMLSKVNRYSEALTYAHKGTQLILPHLDDDLKAIPQLESLNGNFIEACAFSAFHAKAQALSGLATKENAQKMLSLALQHYDLLFKGLDRQIFLYKKEMLKNSSCQIQDYWIEGAIDVALKLYEHSRDTVYLNKAFQLSEKGKAYSLLLSLKIAQGREEAQIPDELKEEEFVLKNSIQLTEELIFNTQQEEGTVVTAKILELEKKLFQFKWSYDSLVLANQDKYPHFWRLKQKIQLPALADVQSNLDPGDGLVQYYFGEDHIYFFGITNETYEIHLCQNDSNLVATLEEIKDWTSLKEDKEEFDFTSNNFLIYQQLLQPFLQNKNIKRLHIIPDGLLNYIPFEILLTGEVEEEDKQQFRHLPYLIKEMPVSYEYSCALFLEQEKKPQETKKYLGMAPAYEASVSTNLTEPDSMYTRLIFRNLRSEMSPLEHNVPEILASQKNLSGESLAGSIATEDQFKAKAADFDILHLAMHAQTNDLDPDYSRLVFSKSNTQNTEKFKEDGFLHAYEIANMRLNAQLAVLSACNTGAGQYRRGEGVMSLARAFKYAGCPNVVMSLWPVNDASTQKVVTSFFDNLKKGMAKDVALQEAKLTYLKSTKNPELVHPFFWAGFILVGDEKPMVLKNNQKIYWILGGVGLLLLLLTIIKKP